MSLFAVPPRQLKLQFVEVCNCSHPLSQIERIFQNMTRQNLFDILVFIKKNKTKQNKPKKKTRQIVFYDNILIKPIWISKDCHIGR